MKTLVLDPFSGVAGDMMLGLLLDLGLPEEQLRQDLKELPLSNYRLEIAKQNRGGIEGTQVDVQVDQDQPHRTWREVRQILGQSSLEEAIRQRAEAVFQRLAEAEGRVHGTPAEEVHFHEVGAVDALVDIVGVVAGLFRLGVRQVISAPLPMTRGFVETAHGRLPLPAPATLALLEGIPVVWEDQDQELVTPTGAALVAETATFAPFPDGPVQRIGYGVGHRELTDRPNLLRGLLLDRAGMTERDSVVVLESHLDDANPEWLGALMDDLMGGGALDVAFSPLQMKKNRPGTRLTVILPPALEKPLVDMILRQSSTAGVRRSLQQRHILRSRVTEIETPLGPAKVKHFFQGAEWLRSTPEFDSCRALADQHQLPLPDVYRIVQTALSQETPS